MGPGRYGCRAEGDTPAARLLEHQLQEILRGRSSSREGDTPEVRRPEQRLQEILPGDTPADAAVGDRALYSRKLEILLQLLLLR